MSAASSAPTDLLLIDPDEVVDAPERPTPAAEAGSGLLPQLAGLVAMAYLAAVTTGLATVAVGTLARGWTPIVVAPSPAVAGLRAGDVLLVGQPTADDRAITVAAIGTDRPSRVRRVNPAAPEEVFVTIDGQRPDRLEPRSADTVTGVGRLVVPVIGLPVVWADEGRLGTFSAWLLFTVSATALAANRLWNRVAGRRRRGFPVLGLDPTWRPAARQLGPFRVAAIVVIGADVLVRGPAHEAAAGRLPLELPWLVPALAAITALAVTTRLGRPRADHQPVRIWPLVAIDWGVVAGLSVLVGLGGPLWLMPALPLLEAAVLIGVTGAAATWTSLAMVATIVRLGALGAQGPDAPHVVWGEQVSGLLVIAALGAPAAVAVDRMIATMASLDRRMRAAATRTSLLTELARAGQQMSRFGQLPLDTIVETTLALGFDAADVVETKDGVEWTVLASGGRLVLPAAGGPGSGLRRRDQEQPGTLIDPASGDDLDRAALAEADLGSVVVQRVTERAGRTTVLRAGTRAPTVPDGARTAGVQMLAGQAAIAFQNSDLLLELQATRDDLQHRQCGPRRAPSAPGCPPGG
ncbi:MAG: hypothetical protein AAGK32_03335, partial [Actinomycetota bacterium]